MLQRLSDAEVSFILVGGLAVNAWGYLRTTRDVDVVPDPSGENLDKLNAVLVELGGRVDRGFAEVDRRFAEVDRRFGEVDRRLEKLEVEFGEFRIETNRRFEMVSREFIALRGEMEDGFDKLYRTMLGLCGSLLVVVVGFLFTH